MVITTFDIKYTSDTDFWLITEALHYGEKKVVIQHYFNKLIEWDSGFRDLASARAYWLCLEANEWNPRLATEAYKATR